jgi:hypothetical protein
VLKLRPIKPKDVVAYFTETSAATSRRNTAAMSPARAPEVYANLNIQMQKAARDVGRASGRWRSGRNKRSDRRGP